MKFTSIRNLQMNLQVHAARVPTIYEYVTASEQAAYWNTFQEEVKPYLGEVLFPNDKQLGLTLDYIKGAGGLPIAIKPSAFDVETPLRDRIGFEAVSQKMPFFKEGYLVKEEDRQKLNILVSSGNQAMIDTVVNRIFRDNIELIQGVRVQAERMRMQLLSTGKIAIKSNKLSLNYDFHLPKDNTETLVGEAKWSDPAADIVGDIERWVDYLQGQGHNPDKILMSKKTFNYLKKNKAIIDALKASTGVSMIINNATIKTFIEDVAGLTIVVYNEKFRDENKKATAFYPDDVVTLLPPGNLGNTMYGTTPEESDLMTGTDAQVEIVNTGVALTTIKRADPVNVFTKASAIMLPTCPAIDSIFIANV